MEEKHKIPILMLIYITIIFSIPAQAINDVNITIDNSKGLCLYQQNPDCQYCDNETLILSGTSDHYIYLTNQRPYGNCDNWTLDSNQTIQTYLVAEDQVYEYVRVSLFYVIFIGGGITMLLIKRRSVI